MAKTAKPKEYKLDIFQVLNHISSKDVNYYSNLTEEEQKAFQPLVVERWLTGTTDARQIYFMNELVNPFVFPLNNHKPLLYKLMTICTSGKQQRYFWNKTVSKKSSSMPTVVGVIKEYYRYSTTQALEVLPLLSDDDILEFADNLGRQKEEITKLKKELKSRV